MSITSSRSAKAIRSLAPEVAESGTPAIEEKSASISYGYTKWTIQLVDGGRYIVQLPGMGRISYGARPGGDGAEVRFYADKTTKVFEAVIPHVSMVFSNRVSIEKAPPSADQLARDRVEQMLREKREDDYEKDRLEKITTAIIRKEYGEVPF